MTSTGSLPIALDSSTIAVQVSSEVWVPRMTSTSFITVAGLKKCIPINFSGRFVDEAISVMEMEEVLEARMVSLLQILSNSAKMLFLMSRFSMAASTTRSASAARLRSVVKVILSAMAILPISSILPLETSLSRLLFSRVSDFWIISSLMSRTTTS